MFAFFTQLSEFCLQIIFVQRDSSQPYDEAVTTINVMNEPTKCSLMLYFAKMPIYLLW